MAKSIQKVRIRKTHPGLYRSLMILGFMGVGLCANFWFSHPTFNPYGIPREVIGTIFGIVGFSQLIALNLFRSLRAVRINLAFNVSWMFFWGVSNTTQFFAGKSSLQLPILFITLAILQIPLLTESPINPMTEKR